MEIMFIVLLTTVCISLTIFHVATMNNLRLNSLDNSETPEFTITKIEQTIDYQHNVVKAKYTVRNINFLTKTRDYQSNSFFFYGKVGQFNLGDNLYLKPDNKLINN